MDKNLLITGGSRGIGAATAILAASQGYRVCINYLSDHGAAERVCGQIREAGGHAIAIQADVSNEDEIIRLFSRVDSELGRLSALVNNAGTVGEASRVETMSEFRMLKIMMSNVVGPMLCSKHALLRMLPRHGGHGGSIVNVSSAAARLGSPGEYVDYAASKGALDTFTVGLARELATEGIRGHAVRPGIVRTEIHASGGQPDRAERLAPLVPMQRPGEPDEIAAAVAWL